MIRDVTAAVFIKEGKVMICRRPPNKGNALKWEFPGGKSEPGETLEECLRRECDEELGIEISVGREICATQYEYPDITVKLHFLLSEIVSGTPEMKEHVDIKYITKSELSDYDFCPADRDIVKILAEENYLD
mgnify:FL=1